MPTDITQSVDESETEKLKTTLVYGSSKESEPTSATDELFDATTEQSDMITTLPENDEYEIVPDTTCDDGEWVESDDEPLASIKLYALSHYFYILQLIKNILCIIGKTTFIGEISRSKRKCWNRTLFLT